MLVLWVRSLDEQFVAVFLAHHGLHENSHGIRSRGVVSSHSVVRIRAGWLAEGGIRERERDELVLTVVGVVPCWEPGSVRYLNKGS